MRAFFAFGLALCLFGLPQAARAQSFGVELFNTLTPASGGMAGASIANPQDNVSAINGNPATLTLYRGTQFTLGGAWVGPTFDLSQTGSIGTPPIISPFSAKSSTPGVAAPSIGVTQGSTILGRPVTFGLGFVGTAGGGTSFRSQAANGTNTYLLFLNFAGSVGVQLTDRLSLGTGIFVGSGYMDGPFIGNSTMTNAYGIRGSVGANYALTEKTNLGCYYLSKENFRFKDEVRLSGPGGVLQPSLDLHMDMPDSVGMGIANSRLANGRLLLAADVLYIDWRNAALFRDIYRNQWVMQLGTQYSVNQRVRLRLGYALAENPINPNTGSTIDGISQGGFNGIKYLQAQFGVINQHRLTAGVSVADVMPGLDFNAFAGGMFEASQQFGPLTSISVESYWIGVGFTWRYGQATSDRGPNRRA
jgi:long-chain fatty acid transport protein